MIGWAHSTITSSFEKKRPNSITLCDKNISFKNNVNCLEHLEEYFENFHFAGKRRVSMSQFTHMLYNSNYHTSNGCLCVFPAKKLQLLKKCRKMGHRPWKERFFFMPVCHPIQEKSSFLGTHSNC